MFSKLTLCMISASLDQKRWQLFCNLFWYNFYLQNNFGQVIILCLCAVGCLTGCALVVASLFVVLLCRNLTTTESMVTVWRL